MVFSNEFYSFFTSALVVGAKSGLVPDDDGQSISSWVCKGLITIDQFFLGIAAEKKSLVQSTKLGLGNYNHVFYAGNFSFKQNFMNDIVSFFGRNFFLPLLWFMAYFVKYNVRIKLPLKPYISASTTCFWATSSCKDVHFCQKMSYLEASEVHIHVQFLPPHSEACSSPLGGFSPQGSIVIFNSPHCMPSNTCLFEHSIFDTTIPASYTMFLS